VGFLSTIEVGEGRVTVEVLHLCFAVLLVCLLLCLLLLLLLLFLLVVLHQEHTVMESNILATFRQCRILHVGFLSTIEVGEGRVTVEVLHLCFAVLLVCLLLRLLRLLLLLLLLMRTHGLHFAGEHGHVRRHGGNGIVMVEEDIMASSVLVQELDWVAQTFAIPWILESWVTVLMLVFLLAVQLHAMLVMLLAVRVANARFA